MTYVQCQHTSAETAPCRCPVWEAPENGQSEEIHLCDTCGHRAEWHLPKSADNHGDGSSVERCKASWPNDQPCSCPTWISSEDPIKNPGCALCGHKKGWHRPTIVHSSSSQSQLATAQSATLEALKLTQFVAHSRAQSFREAGPYDESIRHRSYSNQSWAPGSNVSSHSHQNSESSRDMTHSRFASDTSMTSPSSLRSTSGLPVVRSPAVLLAAEHIRFILSDLDADGDEGSDSESGYLNASQLSNMDLFKAETHIESAMSPGDFFPTPSESSFSVHSHEEKYNKTYYNSRNPSQCSDNQFNFQSSTSNENLLVLTEPRLPPSEFKGQNSHHRGVKSCPDGFNIESLHTSFDPSRSVDTTCSSFHSLTLDGVKPQRKEFSRPLNNQVRTSPNAPLVAQTTSVTFVDELPVDRPKHPSEERSGRFASKNSDVPLYDEPTEAIKPFHTNTQAFVVNEIPVLDFQSNNSVLLKPMAVTDSHLHNSYQSLLKKQKFEHFQSKDQAISLSVSPPPSSTVFSPGDYMDITIKLNSINSNNTVSEITSPVEFDQNLAKWKKISFHMIGFVTQNGTRQDSTQHEIFNLSQLIDLSDQHQHSNSNKTGWQFRLRIANYVNCDCGPGHLPLPSSCSNSVGHVSYYLSLVAKKKLGVCLKARLTNTDSKIYADLRLKNPSPGLFTHPVAIRSLPIWTSLTGGKKVAITDTSLTYQVEFISTTKLNVLYEVVLKLSPDSELTEVNMEALQDLSSKLVVKVASLNQFIRSDSSSAASSRVDMERDEGEITYKSRDFRVKSEPGRCDSSGLIVWKISGYLRVDFQRPAFRLSSRGSNAADSLRTQLKSHVSKAELGTPSKNSVSQWILRASIQSVLLSQPINVCGTLTDLQSNCAARSIMQGLPLAPR